MRDVSPLLHLGEGKGVRLSRKIRHQGHKTGAFDGKSKLLLIFGRNTGSLFRKDAGMRIDELFQKFGIFVINVFDTVLFEIAGLFICHEFRKVYLRY